MKAYQEKSLTSEMRKQMIISISNFWSLTILKEHYKSS